MKSPKLMCVVTLVLLAAAPATLASTTWYADGVNGSDSNDCKSPTTACKTIGHAISLASSGDTIRVAAATYYERITINISLKIIGSGAKTTIINGWREGRVVTIQNSAVQVTLSKMTISEGLTGEYGGGIYNSGRLTINKSTITHNVAVNHFASSKGGGIYNIGALTISSSTIAGNRVDGGNPFYPEYSQQGGGIYNAGLLTLNNTTLANNTAYSSYAGSAAGGGIYSFSGVTFNNSTIAGNVAAAKYDKAFGGGVVGHADLQNSIVAYNTAPSNTGNCYGAIDSTGYNMSSDDSCHFTNSGDWNHTDPKLGLLQNNGGPTQTMALPSGSRAVDAGNPGGCKDGNGHLLKTDQRGKPRPGRNDTGGCDMGAYELQTD